MLIARPRGNNVRVHGKSQGFLGLPVNHVREDDGVNVMETAWTPTPDELSALNAGANVTVSIWGDLPPPMLVFTSAPPDGEQNAWKEQSKEHAQTLIEAYRCVESVELKEKINQLAKWLNFI